MVGVLALLPEPRPNARNLPTRQRRARRRSLGEQDSTSGPALRIFEQALSGSDGSEVAMSKSSDKPKKQQKQKPQKTQRSQRQELLCDLSMLCGFVFGR